MFLFKTIVLNCEEIDISKKKKKKKKGNYFKSNTIKIKLLMLISLLSKNFNFIYSFLKFHFFLDFFTSTKKKSRYKYILVHFQEKLNKIFSNGHKGTTY